MAGSNALKGHVGNDAALISLIYSTWMRHQHCILQFFQPTMQGFAKTQTTQLYSTYVKKILIIVKTPEDFA